MRSAPTSDEIKARKVTLQDLLLLFLGRSTTNGRERYASLVAKETYKILEKLVTIPGRLNAWAHSKGIRVPFDPPKIIAHNLIPLEIATKDITNIKTHPYKFIHCISAKDLMLMNAKEIKQKIEAEIGPYLCQVYGDNRFPNL